MYIGPLKVIAILKVTIFIVVAMIKPSCNVKLLKVNIMENN